MSEHSYEEFLEVHEGQLLASKVPQRYWPALFRKLKDQVMDAGKCFEFVMEISEDNRKKCFVYTTSDLNVDNENNIFLIDHAWSFRPNTARLALQQVDGLKERLLNVFGLEEEVFKDGLSESSDGEEGQGDQPGCSRVNIVKVKHSDDVEKEDQTSLKGVDDSDKVINTILDELWRFAQTYTIRICKSDMDEGDLPIWYLPDELGIHVAHDLVPNTRMIPFFYVFDNTAYSLLFPIHNVSNKEEVTRNYLDTVLFHKHPQWHKFLMYPWRPMNIAEAADIELEEHHVFEDNSYFTSNRVPDDLPPNTKNGIIVKKSADTTVKVFTNNEQLLECLKKVKTVVTEDMYDADILWLRNHFHNFRQLAENNPNALINQFPYESVLTVKDLTAAVIQKDEHLKVVDGEEWALDWFPITFNLNYELPQFVRYYLRREMKGLNNVWIVKPWNLARGMDTFVTRNLNCIIRMAESGPKIVCKYVENPVLFCRPDNNNMVKFDVRYIVFLKSVQPLEISLYKDFFVRFAINEFNLNVLDDVQTHLTVHNYSGEGNVLNIECQDFIRQFEEQYPNLEWKTIQSKVDDVIRKVFAAVTANQPPRGIASNAQSRAMYGFDLMLYWKEDQSDVGVAFIEANFMPDCKRACTFYPDFADIAFGTLFFDEKNDKVVPL